LQSFEGREIDGHSKTLSIADYDPCWGHILRRGAGRAPISAARARRAGIPATHLNVAPGAVIEETFVTAKLEFFVRARRVDASGSVATCKDATLTLDTALAGRRDALNPAELLLAALSACMIKGIERVAPMLKFSLRGVDIHMHGIRQDAPPRMERIDYEIVVDTDEPDRRLELLHDNVKKYGTVFNTVAPGTDLTGVLVRAK
jgi:uncharacterized OsmC-like protein